MGVAFAILKGLSTLIKPHIEFFINIVDLNCIISNLLGILFHAA